MQDRTHLKEIEYLSSFGCFLVVFLHALTADMGKSLNANINLSFIFLFFYRFLVPLFMFLSGYLFIYTTIKNKNLSYIGYVNKRFKRLIIPYLCISSLVFIPKALLSKYAMRQIGFNFLDYLRGIFYPWHNPLILYWYLPTLFIISLAAPLLYRMFLYQRRTFVIWLTIIVFALIRLYHPVQIKILNIEGVLSYLIYFWSGCVFFFYRDKFSFLNSKYTLLISFLFLLCVNYLIATGFAIVPLNLMKLVAALVGIVMSFSLIKLLVNNKKFFLEFVNGYAYQVFLLHWFAQIFFRIILYQIMGVGYFYVFIFMFISGLYLPILWTKFIKKRFPRLNFIIGLN